MAGLVIKPRSRILHGHDWVYASEVLKAFGSPQDGDVVSLKDGRDQLLGTAIYNSKSQIIARRISRQRQDLDPDFFRRRLKLAIDYRARRGIDPRLCRLVWSESDGLPGVIVDRYGDHLVLQTLTLAMDQKKVMIAELMRSSCSESCTSVVIDLASCTTTVGSMRCTVRWMSAISRPGGSGARTTNFIGLTGMSEASR